MNVYSILRVLGLRLKAQADNLGLPWLTNQSRCRLSVQLFHWKGEVGIGEGFVLQREMPPLRT